LGSLDAESGMAERISAGRENKPGTLPCANQIPVSRQLENWKYFFS
jgi:hypothetical protein